MVTSSGSRSYAGRPVLERRAERRERFIRAGLIAISERGFADTAIADLCREAGLSRRQFYEEFSGREDLLIAVYDRIHEDATTAVRGALAKEESPDPVHIARTALRAYAQSIGSDRRRVKIAFVEIVGVNEHVERHRQERRHKWAAMFEAVIRAVRGDEFRPPGGYALAAAAFIGAANGLVQEWSLLDDQPPICELVDVLATILLSLVVVPDGPVESGPRSAPPAVKSGPSTAL